MASPLGSSILAPGVPELIHDFHSTNIYLASLVVTVYLLGFAAGPLVLAPLSELYGMYGKKVLPTLHIYARGKTSLLANMILRSSHRLSYL